MASLSVDKHCEMLTAHIRDRNAAIMDGFKLYVQMFSAVVGGAVVLRLQYGPDIPSLFAGLSDALAGLIFLMGAVIILENVRSWYDFRKALSDVAGTNKSRRRIVPAPKVWKSMRIELVMLAVMAIAWLAFYLFNPLRVLS